MTSATAGGRSATSAAPAPARGAPRADRSAAEVCAKLRDPVTTPPPLIIIGAGGTAGHVVPALAVADALSAEGARVVFVGGERAERTMVPEAGYELRPIAVEGLSRSNPLKAARAALKAMGAVGT